MFLEQVCLSWKLALMNPEFWMFLTPRQINQDEITPIKLQALPRPSAKWGKKKTTKGKERCLVQENF